MAYYTYYELEDTYDEETDSAIEEELFEYVSENKAEFKEFIYAIIGKNACAWYNHEIDMIKLSKKFPRVIFTLLGKGDETFDLWKKYFYKGMMQIAKAEVTFPSFRKDKLEKIDE